jgi:hypothetical protein
VHTAERQRIAQAGKTVAMAAATLRVGIVELRICPPAKERIHWTLLIEHFPLRIETTSRAEAPRDDPGFRSMSNAK